MQTITVDKKNLLIALQENRSTHQADYELAWQGYKEKAIKGLEEMLHKVRTMSIENHVDSFWQLQPPENHLEDYDRAIEMLEWEQSDTIKLTEHEFRNLVQDNWNWKHQFETANVMYAGSASPSTFK